MPAPFFIDVSVQFVDFYDFHILFFDGQFESLACLLDPIVDGSMTNFQDASDSSKAESFEIHIEGLLPYFFEYFT